MYTVIPYRYVDAANFKQYGEIVLQGELSLNEQAEITAKLYDGRFFVPFDLGLHIPELQRQMEGFPSADDHVFHELMLDEMRTQGTKPAGILALRNDDFLAAFSRVRARDGWDVAAAIHRLGL